MHTPAPLPQPAVDRLVRQTLEEDAPWPALTSQTLLPLDAQAKASLVAREHGVLAGVQLFVATMLLVDPSIDLITQHDAQPFFPGDVLATAEGPARSILQAERVALTFVRRLSGIATLTAQFVEAIKGTSARIVDTRNSTPTLRPFERYAVRCGGGTNHRDSDTVRLTRNHLTAQPGADLTQLLRRARQTLPDTTSLEAEIDHPSQLDTVLAALADTIVLKDFTPDQLRAAVQHVRRNNAHTVVEATGTIRLDTVRAVAETGVDLISVSALTDSVHSLDLDVTIQPADSPRLHIPGR